MNKFKIGDEVKLINIKNSYYNDLIEDFDNLERSRINKTAIIDNIINKHDLLCLQFETGNFTNIDYYNASCFELVNNSIKHEVDEVFIKEAHSAACNDWKIKIEEQFPLVFPKKTIESVLKENNISSVVYSNWKIKIQEGIIKIPLPIDNSVWTFRAYKLAEKICSVFTEAYPYHNDMKTCTRFIYIKVDKI